MTDPSRLRCDLTSLSRLIHQCYTMLNAGMGLVQALRVLSEQQDQPGLAQALPALVRRVESGHSLASSMAEFPGIFSQPVMFLVRAGEESGQMVALFEQLAVWLEKDAGVWQRTRQAMVYPAMVLGVAVFLTWALFSFFLPPFFAAFTSSGTPLPPLTVVVLMLSKIAGHPLFWLLSGVGLLALRHAARRAWSDRRQRVRLFQVLRSVPLLGKIVMLTGTVRFANCLSVMLNCGLPLTRAWPLAAAASGDAVLQQDGDRIVALLRHGDTLGECLATSPEYPRGFAGLVSAAEESGGLSSTLSSLAKVYDQEADYLTQALSILFEPVFIAGLALMVVTILLAVLLPLYGTLDQIGA